MGIEIQTVAVFKCGYREEAPPDPDDISPDDPNGLMYREGEYGHAYCYMAEDCPGCDGGVHDSIYPYARKSLRIIVQK